MICVESSDLHTLETALLVRDLRPDVRVVVHLDNPAVGGAVEGITGAGSVLDVAGLFAPSVVDACLGRSAHDLELGGQHFVAAEVSAPRDGTLRELYGDLAPVAVLSHPDETRRRLPGPRPPRPRRRRRGTARHPGGAEGGRDRAARAARDRGAAGTAA